MNEATIKRLQTLVTEGETLTNTDDIQRWSARASTFIKQVLGDSAFTQFDSLTGSTWSEQHALKLGHIEGLLALEEATHSGSRSDREQNVQAPDPTTHSVGSVSRDGRKVFVVHGHDNEAKEGVARFLQKLGLEPIILHEQASGGRTVIEKFEMYSQGVAYAVVLLTPDDVGAVAADATMLKGRARQNVIMELGYFIGKLGRVRVCALHKGSVELPSDYRGVIYVEMDQAGAWRTKLAQELVQAKISIDLTGLLES